jgi:hypothetical protein
MFQMARQTTGLVTRCGYRTGDTHTVFE